MDIIKQGKNDTEKEKPEVTEQINVNQLISLVPEEEPAPVIKLEITEEDQKTIENFHFPAYNEIPDVGLFLEQTGKYINEFLRPLLKTELTGSMISNYVKKKIIESPVKKQYYRDHIVVLILIAIAKPILSLDSISRMVEVEKTLSNSREMYETFCGIFEETLKKTFHLSDEKQIDEDGDNATIVMRYISAAVSYKIFLDRCFEQTYTPT